MKELNDTNFNEMSYEHLLKIVKRIVPHSSFEKVYYCQTGAKLCLGIRDIKSDQDIIDMLKVGYNNGNAIDMFVEHFGYDIMERAKFDRNGEQKQNIIESYDDDYNSSDDYQEIENVDFQTEGDDSVVIKNISLEDPFLNKLCSSRIMFRVYPAFNPDISWDKMKPLLGMRNVAEGRCVSKKGNKDKLMPIKAMSGVSKGKQGNKSVKNKVFNKKGYIFWGGF
nr:hypothetical protein [Tanacetum cinerariifolium]